MTAFDVYIGRHLEIPQRRKDAKSRTVEINKKLVRIKTEINKDTELMLIVKMAIP